MCVHIFLRTFGALDLVGLCICEVGSLVMYFEYTGAEVPPEGPLILLLSVILLPVDVKITRRYRSFIVYLKLSRSLSWKVTRFGKLSGRAF